MFFQNCAFLRTSWCLCSDEMEVSKMGSFSKANEKKLAPKVALETLVEKECSSNLVEQLDIKCKKVYRLKDTVAEERRFKFRGGGGSVGGMSSTEIIIVVVIIVIVMLIYCCYSYGKEMEKKEREREDINNRIQLSDYMSTTVPTPNFGAVSQIHTQEVANAKSVPKNGASEPKVGFILPPSYDPVTMPPPEPFLVPMPPNEPTSVSSPPIHATTSVISPPVESFSIAMPSAPESSSITMPPAQTTSIISPPTDSTRN